MPQRHAVGRDERGQIVAGQVQPLAQATTVFALRINQPMRDVVLIQEVIELTAFARILRCHDAQPGKLAVALQAAAGA